jgi:subtilisin family serine protease
VQLRSLSDRHIPEGELSTSTVLAQRRAMTAARGRLLALLPRAGHRVLRQFATVPYVALELSSAALPALEASPDVVRIMEDQIVPATLMDTIPSIQADQVWATGFDGTGTTVAILDTGIETHHAFFGGRVTQEACYSSTVLGISTSVCPDGQDVQVGAGSAVP